MDERIVVIGILLALCFFGVLTWWSSSPSGVDLDQLEPTIRAAMLQASAYEDGVGGVIPAELCVKIWDDVPDPNALNCASAH